MKGIEQMRSSHHIRGPSFDWLAIGSPNKRLGRHMKYNIRVYTAHHIAQSYLIPDISNNVIDPIG